MKLRSLLLVAATAAVVAPLSSIATLHADTPTIGSAAKVPRLPAPPALEPAKRSVRLSAALKAAGFTSSPPQTLEMRLTPVAPRLPGSAEILRAGPGQFNGADSDEPDGSYTLLRGNGMMALSLVEMRVPTQAGKLYVYDCRVKVVGTTKVVFSRNGAGSLVQVEDGHIIGAFSATGPSTLLTLAASPGSGNEAVLAHFYGCDVGKAG